jgi:hypothetical protein
MWVGSVEDAIVRVHYSATSEQARRIDNAEIRAALARAGAAVVKVEPDIVREDRVRVAAVTEELAPLDAYDLWKDAQELAPDLALRARARLADHLETVAA